MKMGTTQTGWRVYVKKGDRIATNGVYDTRKYAFPDQMSVVGMYYDDSVEVKDSDRCKAGLVNEPNATLRKMIQSVPDQDSQRGDDGSTSCSTRRRRSAWRTDATTTGRRR